MDGPDPFDDWDRPRGLARASLGAAGQYPHLEEGRHGASDGAYRGRAWKGSTPLTIVSPFAGDRGDIAAKHAWKDGVWTLVMARKLVTNSEFDVQFRDTKKEYAFGVAIFDNAQVRHAYSTGVFRMKFE